MTKVYLSLGSNLGNRIENLRFAEDEIRKKIIKLSNQSREELSKISGITLYGPEDQERRTGIVSFSIENHEPQKVCELLEKRGIVLAVREIMDKKILRISPHFFNSEEDIEKVIEEIKKL